MYDEDRVVSSLPSLMRLCDGTEVRTVADFEKKRKEIVDIALMTEFGGMPPHPEFTSFRSVAKTKEEYVYRLCYGTDKIQRDFQITLYLPPDFTEEKIYPVLLSGDGCWKNRFWRNEDREQLLREGVIIALFDRTEIAPDKIETARSRGIYEIYEGASFSTISAWAYGYHRAMDFLLTCPYADKTQIGITGHSRGGKAALLAGATDERIPFVNANGSGSHGAGCWHYESFDSHAKGDDTRSEPLSFLCEVVPYWLGPDLFKYAGKEEMLPYDMHWIKALIAPRYFLETEGFDDLWANPRGSYLSSLAARPAFALYGTPDHNLIHYREGGHFHQVSDRMLLISLMKSVKEQKTVPEELQKTYFEGLEEKMKNWLYERSTK